MSLLKEVSGHQEPMERSPIVMGQAPPGASGKGCLTCCRCCGSWGGGPPLPSTQSQALANQIVTQQKCLGLKLLSWLCATSATCKTDHEISHVNPKKKKKEVGKGPGVWVKCLRVTVKTQI